MTATELKRHALELPTEEKLDLVETLWQSLEHESAEVPLYSWQEKLLAERLDEARRDPSVWISEEEVMKEAEEALRARRRA
jgi:putative addiction module component (TIGR02574 family)